MIPNSQQLIEGIMRVSRKLNNEGSETFAISSEMLNQIMNNIEPPKRPPSSFILYKTKNKEKLLEIFSGVKRSADLSKCMVEHYKNLSKSEKSVYEEEYAQLKTEYDSKMELHLKYFPKSEKKKRGRPRKNKNTEEPVNPNNKATHNEIETIEEVQEQESTVPVRKSSSKPNKFVRITDKESNTVYSVNLTTGLYYDVDAPWGSALGRYCDNEKTFKAY
jgi:hypothetical protein